MSVRIITMAATTLLLAACSSAMEPARTQDPGVSVDSARMMRVAGALAHDSMAGRGVGTEGGQKARRLLGQELGARGIAPLVPGFEQSFTFTRSGNATTGINLLGVIRGTREPGRYIVATAHYDHVGTRNGEIFNGADDNASGTVALLELASWFQAHPPQRSIIIALLDAEEAGLRGAQAFLSQPPVPVDSILLNVNMDMVGRNVHNELYAVGTHRYPQLRLFVEAAAKASPIRLRMGHDGSVAGEQDWTGMSDQAPFHQRGIPFLYFGVEDHADYHKSTDDVERLHPSFFAGAARTIIDIVSRIDRSAVALR